MNKRHFTFAFSLVVLTITGCNNISDSSQNSGAYFTNKNIAPDESLLEPSSYKRESMYVYKHAYLNEDEFPIVGMITPPCSDAGGGGNPSFINRDNFKRFKNAGFNIMMPCYERTNFREADCRKAMQICNDLELVYFANDTRYRAAGSDGYDGTIEQYENVLDEFWFMKEPCYGGMQIKDEPNCLDFDEFNKVNTAYKNVVGENTILHTSLFPFTKSDDDLYRVPNYKEKSYQETYEYYVKDYLDKAKPCVLAYDQYIWHYLYTQGLNLDATTDYFNSLSFYNEQSKLRNVPFWPTIASYKHAYPKCFTDEETYWTVNTALAYGARGIQYYVYWPQLEGYTTGDYKNNVCDHGMVTADGVPTDAYYRIQYINRQVQQFASTLLNSKHKGIMEFGEYKDLIQEKDLLSEFGPLTNISGGDAFVGCFAYGDKYVYYIVNNNINDGTGSGHLGDSIFKIDFNKKTNGFYYNIDIRNVAFSNAYSICFRLSPGKAMLLEV